MAERVVVLGGIRSGKSAVAESLVAGAAAVRYVATGTASDEEMAERIATHRVRRPPTWETVESSDVAGAIRGSPPGSAVLIDAFGPWLAAHMTAHGLWATAPVQPWGAAGRRGIAALVAEAEAFWETAADHDGGPVVLVADEAGLGLVPADASSRRWLDVAGEVLQRLAATADRVLLVVAGRVVDLYGCADPRADLAGGHDGGLDVHGDSMVPAGSADFAVNVHGDGPPAHIRAVLDAALDRAAAYPDDTAARAAAAGRHGRDAGDVLVTNGAAEALHLLATIVRARHAVCVHPAYTQPEAALRRAGMRVTRALRRAEDGWRLDPSTVPRDADLVVVANPNNPTGTLDDPETLAALCRAGRVTVVDEAFLDFVADQAPVSLAGRTDLPGLVVVRSVTKLWGLAGVRAGYLVGSPGLVARCVAARPPWATSALALAAVQACARDETYRRRVAAEVAGARSRLAAALARLPGVTVAEGAANFLLARVADGRRVHAELLDRGVAVRPSTFPGLGPDYLRVAVRDPLANDRLVAALQAVLATTARSSA